MLNFAQKPPRDGHASLKGMGQQDQGRDLPTLQTDNLFQFEESQQRAESTRGRQKLSVLECGTSQVVAWSGVWMLYEI